MRISSATDELKRAAAERAVEEVTSGMVVGLGTGSTAAYAVAALGRRVARGLEIRTVATSRATEAQARAAGIAIVPLEAVAAIDLCIDGVDEIDPAMRAIKGGGGAMLIEKIVGSMAERNVAIADGSKLVGVLGGRAVPLEVLPAAVRFVSARAVALGGTCVRRLAGDAAFVTDSGHAIVDCGFEAIPDPASLAAALSAIPGVLGHGLFLDEIDALYVAGANGVVLTERSTAAKG